MTSGLRISCVRMLGPREEKAATLGALREGPVTVPRKRIVAVGLAGEVIVWASATSSSPLSSVLARIMPAPPASFTALPFSTRALEPRSQRTIFPATFSGSRRPLMHSRLPQSPA
ncbi:unnamed protein product [Spirodela intermedia]|uniref:Uncharacterized protein n=1 Tax=Spirodela intermedia TaxID=51605 RepID=A0A7I8J5E2_SPIIN|nr:unnamed protein product [Spirodela intermedia]CAA6664641.1 unnamed protein product [Spirodela intermedia]